MNVPRVRTAGDRERVQEYFSRKLHYLHLLKGVARDPDVRLQSVLLAECLETTRLELLENPPEEV